MSRITLVRHGPTHQKNFVGWRDVPADLSDTAALARLSAALPDSAALISSDLIRAIATADAVATPARQRLPHDPELREFNFGEWDGLSFPEVAERDPHLSRSFWEQPGDIAPPGGESWNAVTARVSARLDALARTHDEVIVVAHVGVIMTQIGRVLGPEAALGEHIENLSLTELIYEPDGLATGRVNHLA
ncbi:MAG: histidine phosphatase family protein [Maritimibacter sp.]|jgi:alpha-ribazole phosphatase